MKILAIGLSALAVTSVKAASLEESYLASRNGYIAKIARLEKSPGGDEKVAREHDRALADLEKRLQMIVGDVVVEGFSAKGKISLETLSSGDVGFGLLDGLVHASNDGKSRFVVTNQALLRDWLRGPKSWWDGKKNPPQNVVEALKTESFYTQATSTDSAVFKYVELPIVKPGRAAIAVAILDARSQDLPPLAPDEIIVSLVAGGRVFVASAPPKAKIDAIKTCAQAREAMEKRADNAADHSIRLRDEIALDYQKCFAAHAPRKEFFKSATQEAQALVDRLAAQ